VAGSVEDSNGVGEKVRHGVQGFDGAFGAAGKIDDEGAMPDDGDATREDGGGRFFGAFAAEFLGDAGNGALGDVQSGFGSIIARAEAGAAGGEDEIDAARVGEFAKLAAKAGRIVGTAERGGDFPAEFAYAFDERGAGEIFAFTAGDGITDGEDGDTHSWGLFYMRRKGKAPGRYGVCAIGTGCSPLRTQRAQRKNKKMKDSSHKRRAMGQRSSLRNAKDVASICVDGPT